MMPMASLRVLPILILPILALGFIAEAVAQTHTGRHHDITVNLDPGTRLLEVADRFDIEDGQDDITFALAPWMEIVSIHVDGEPVEAARSGESVRLISSGPGPYQVAVALRGTLPPLPQSGSRGGPWGPFADEEGAYLPAYSGWLPFHGPDWISYDLAIQVPLPYRVVATGQLGAEEVADSVYRVSFSSEIPGEPPSLFVGPYEIREKELDGLRLRTYFHPDLAPLSESYLEAAGKHISRYAALIGDYPNKEFHVVSAPIPVGLGFANLTYVGRRVLPLPFMLSRSLAHEVLHSWWGNGVAVDYAQGNWSEGLTTYMADYALTEAEDAEAAKEMRLGWLRNITALPEDHDGPVKHFTSKRHDTAQVIGYDKTALIFHMLRAELGEEAFRDGLRGFWRDHRFKVAAWPDLQAAFEVASGRDLAWFFEQWVAQPGAPSIELLDAAHATGEQGHLVTVTLRQDDPVRQMRLPIFLETTEGIHPHHIRLDQAEQTFKLPNDERPIAIHIDPDFDVLRKLLPGESPPIFRDVTLSPETIVVVPTADERFAQSADQLVQRLLRHSPEFHEDLPKELSGRPVLIIGNTDDVAKLRAYFGTHALAPAVETVLSGDGTARVWVEDQADGSPWMFVATEDAEALQAILRPLPHYRSRSYVTFDGARNLAKGVWEVQSSPLTYRFDF